MLSETSYFMMSKRFSFPLISICDFPLLSCMKTIFAVMSVLILSNFAMLSVFVAIFSEASIFLMFPFSSFPVLSDDEHAPQLLRAIVSRLMIASFIVL